MSEAEIDKLRAERDQFRAELTRMENENMRLRFPEDQVEMSRENRKLRAERDELLAAKPIDKLRNLLVDWHVDFSQEQPNDGYMHLCVPLFATRFIFAAGNGRFMGVQALDCGEKRDG